MKALIFLALIGQSPPLPSPQSPTAEAEVAPPPPVTPAARPIVPQPAPEPAPQVVTLRVQQPAPAPAPTPTVHTIALRLIADPQPAPPPQEITLHVTPTAAPPATAAVVPTTSTVAARVVHPGPVRRALGQLGERLATLGHDRIVVPRQQAQAIVSVSPAQQVVYQPVQAVPLAVTTPQAERVYPSPQAPRK